MRRSIFIGLSGLLFLLPFPIHAQEQAPTIIRGLVRDALTGQAIPGARIHIDAVRAYEATTDAQGRYTFSVIEGRYQIEIEPPDGYAILKTDGRKDIHIETGQVLVVDWSVPRALSASGFTLDGNQKPMGRMPFQVWIGNGGMIDGVSNRDGQFKVNGIPPEVNISFVSRRDGLITDRFERFEIGDQDASGIMVRFYPAARISGTVVTERGDVLPNTQVDWQLTRMEGRGLVDGGTSTNERGRFVMEDMLFGKYEFSIKPLNGRNQRSLVVDVTPGATVDKLRLVYAPDKDLTIHGQIVDENGNGVPNATITAGDTAFTFSFTTQTDGEGRFTLHDLKEGVQYGIGYVDYRGNHYQVMKRIASGAQNVIIRLTLEPAGDIEQYIRGQVVDAESGERIRNFEVAHTRGVADVIDETNPRNVGFMQRPLDHAVRDGDGNLAVRVYRAGEYTVYIRAKTYGQWIGMLQAPSADVRIALEPESRVRGTVVSGEGTPIEGAIILYYKPYGYEAPTPEDIGYMGRTVSDGTFDVGGVAAGEHRITFIHPDYLDTLVHATAIRGSGEPLTVVMQKSGRLAGMVYLDGMAHTRAWINVQHIERPLGYSMASDTESGGYYQIGRLNPGEYIVDVAYELPSGGRHNEQHTALIVAGEETRMDFHLKSEN